MLLPAVFADYLHIRMHAHSALYFTPILLIYRTLRITRSTCQQHVALYIYHTYMCTHILLYTQHCNYTHLLCSTTLTPTFFYMDASRVPAAARSAAVLGSRNARRQLRSVLTAAAEAGAYSVGFCVARGGLTGFSVYFAGDFAGAGKRASSGAAAYYCAAPHSSRGDSTTASAQPTTARAPAASAAPAQPAAARRRGCRAGAK